MDAMYGRTPRRRPLATAATVLLALALAPASSALAQSAGDRQYTDPLVTDGGGERPADGPDTPVSSDDGTGAADGDGAVDLPAGAEPAEFADDAAAGSPAALPRTGADPWLLALLGAAALALGRIALAAARDPRHARR